MSHAESAPSLPPVGEKKNRGLYGGQRGDPRPKLAVSFRLPNADHGSFIRRPQSKHRANTLCLLQMQPREAARYLGRRLLLFTTGIEVFVLPPRTKFAFRFWLTKGCEGLFQLNQRQHPCLLPRRKAARYLGWLLLALSPLGALYYALRAHFLDVERPGPSRRNLRKGGEWRFLVSCVRKETHFNSN